ncbi:hypothetical protein C8R48DRAFT_599506 [Suillus tomentosus]|nr:hypothetical protein C8R48DRAFT_599506 [Suillus tomentosus]
MSCVVSVFCNGPTGLQCFPDGHGFKQWTGKDSKALMKVYIPAIKDHIPEDITHAFSACLGFCYLVWREALTEDDLLHVQEALDRFHQYWEIFKTSAFYAPNGLCSSITESKHIKAVKEPWHRSSRFKALGQMLLTNQCLDKIAAACAYFEAHGMLHCSCLSKALQELQKCT